MKALILVLAMALLGCESEAIGRCGYACKTTGQAMLGYSAKDGCRCVAPDGGRSNE